MKKSPPKLSIQEQHRQQEAARKKMQDQQLAFQRIAREKEARLRELFSEKMEGEVFSQEHYSASWRQDAFAAFMHTQPLSHQTTLEDFSKVVECAATGAAELNLFQIGVLCNSADIATRAQLGLGSGDYLQFLKETVAISDIYKARVKEIRTEIELLVEMEVKAEVEAMGSHGGLKSVMAQA